jgi:hypothetical protein
VTPSGTIPQRIDELTAGGGRRAVDAALALAGARTDELVLRRVHRRRRSASLAYDARIRSADATATPEVLATTVVVHVDEEPLPADALVLDTEQGAVAVWAYPNDPFLPGLASVGDATRAGELLADLGRPDADVEVVVRAYRPARRAVLELIAGRGADRRAQAFVKVLPAARIDPLARVHEDLAMHGLVVPRVLGTSAAQGLLVLEALPGATMRRTLIADDPIPAPTDLVALSRRLATADLRAGRDPRVAADPGRFVARLSRRLPDRAAQVRAVAAAARPDPITGSDPVIVHGDLQPRQLLVREGRLSGVLDLDGAGPGAIADDAGNLITHLEAILDRQPQAEPQVRACTEALVGCYLDVVTASALARARAATWLGLATGALRHARPDARELAARRVDRAAALVESA